MSSFTGPKDKSMHSSCSLAIVLLGSLSLGFSQQTLTQQQACTKFSGAVVGINAQNGMSIGSGFLVSRDGYVLTAMHVVKRPNQDAFYSPLSISLSDGSTEDAHPISRISPETVGQDYALLKIDPVKPQPFLELGSFGDVTTGGDATLIGFPFSAASHEGTMLMQKLCLSASFAGVSRDFIPVPVTQWIAGGSITSNHDVQVDVIYFQGPSIKGVSGSPVISRDNGRVVGIVSTKLTGIGPALGSLRDAIVTKGIGKGIGISGLVPGDTTKEIIDVLDGQLANGLGSAVGIDEPKHALTQAQHTAK